jgi:SAM-dependent methyltransferase
MADVPTDHHWDDPAYTADWSERAETGWYRPRLLAAMAAAVPAGTRHVVELGSGPGLLAEQLLVDHEAITRYVLVDVSPPMHELSAVRLASFTSRTEHCVADFRAPDWVEGVEHGADAVVTLQAVHELRHASRIPALYAQVHDVLRAGGTFVVADFLNRDDDHREHRMTVGEHRSTLGAAGFADAECTLDLGFIACIVARRPDAPAQ